MFNLDDFIVLDGASHDYSSESFKRRIAHLRSSPRAERVAISTGNERNTSNERYHADDIIIPVIYMDSSNHGNHQYQQVEPAATPAGMEGDAQQVTSSSCC
jgi:hypothetical protein